MRIVLASESPRRKEILTLCGFDYDLRVCPVDEESVTAESPEALVLKLAELKSEGVPVYEGEVVISADTIVTLNGEIFGKPKSDEEAFRSIKNFSGTIHRIITGVCIKTLKEQKVFYDITEVEFYKLCDEEIWSYINSGEGRDKAGSYAIQGRGALFVKRINGDFYGGIGLPIARVIKELHDLNLV